MSDKQYEKDLATFYYMTGPCSIAYDNDYLYLKHPFDTINVPTSEHYSSRLVDIYVNKNNFDVRASFIINPHNVATDKYGEPFGVVIFMKWNKVDNRHCLRLLKIGSDSYFKYVTDGSRPYIYVVGETQPYGFTEFGSYVNFCACKPRFHIYDDFGTFGILDIIEKFCNDINGETFVKPLYEYIQSKLSLNKEQNIIPSIDKTQLRELIRAEIENILGVMPDGIDVLREMIEQYLENKN